MIISNIGADEDRDTRKKSCDPVGLGGDEKQYD